MFRALGISIAVGLLVVLFGIPGGAFAQEGACPTNDVTLRLPFKGIKLDQTATTATLAMFVCNGTAQRQTLSLELGGAPEGWDVSVRPTVGLYSVSGVTLDSGNEEELRLRVQAPGNAGRADFDVSVALVSASGEVVAQEAVSVTAEVLSGQEEGSIRVNSRFPILSGPSSGTYEFELNIVNNTGSDASLDLAAQIPRNWRSSFLPAFGTETLINSVAVANGLTERIKIRLTPPAQEVPGDYPILVTVSNEQYTVETPLQVTITGSFSMTLTTPSGRLNVNADAGNTTEATLRIINTGTALIENLSLLSDTPTGWRIEFQPALVSSLPGNNQIDIPFLITPPGDAVPGDYVVTLRARNPQVSGSIALRITVEKATVWQWVGIGLLVAVIAALIGVFVKLGRR